MEDRLENPVGAAVAEGSGSAPELAPPTLPAAPPMPSLPPARHAEQVVGGLDWVRELREEVAQAATERFAQKGTDLWAAAEARMQEMEKQQAEVIGQLEEQVRRCHEKHHKLEEDNVQLQRNIAALQEQLEHAEADAAFRQRLLGPQEHQVAARAVAPARSIWMPSSPVPPGLGWPLTQGLVTRQSVNPALPDGWDGLMPPLPLEVPEPTSSVALSEAASLSLGSPRALGAPCSISEPPGLSSPKASTVFSCDSFSSPKASRASEEDAFGTLTPKVPLCSPCSPLPRAATPQRSCMERRSATPARTPPSTPLTPQRAIRSSLGALTKSPMKSPIVPASPFVICEGGGQVFGFMLRLAEGVELGLDVEHGGEDSALRVRLVKPGGAIEAWNRQCVGGPAAGKAVLPGDQIVQVNHASEPLSMLAECRTKQMLRLTIVRGKPECDTDHIWEDAMHGRRHVRDRGRGLLAPPSAAEAAAAAFSAACARGEPHCMPWATGSAA